MSVLIEKDFWVGWHSRHQEKCLFGLRNSANEKKAKSKLKSRMMQVAVSHAKFKHYSSWKIQVVELSNKFRDGSCPILSTFLAILQGLKQQEPSLVTMTQLRKPWSSSPPQEGFLFSSNTASPSGLSTTPPTMPPQTNPPASPVGGNSSFSLLLEPCWHKREHLSLCILYTIALILLTATWVWLNWSSVTLYCLHSSPKLSCSYSNCQQIRLSLHRNLFEPLWWKALFSKKIIL